MPKLILVILGLIVANTCHGQTIIVVGSNSPCLEMAITCQVATGVAPETKPSQVKEEGQVMASLALVLLIYLLPDGQLYSDEYYTVEDCVAAAQFIPAENQPRCVETKS